MSADETTRPCPGCGITAPMGNAVWLGYNPDCSNCGGKGRVNLDGSRWQTTGPRREQSLGNLLKAAEALTNGATGNGHSVFVSKVHLDRLINAVHEVKTHAR